MKNLKKVLALVLVVATLMGFATVAGAKSASDYSDYADVTHNEAVDVMTAVGVLDGSNGKFNPQGILSREEAAKIITYMLLGKAEADKLVAVVAPYADVAKDRWSAGAIAYCTNRGILSGVGNNKFNPTGKLTGLQFAKMCLVSLGYDPKIEEFTGSNWAMNVADLALGEAGLGENLSAASLSGEMSREQAAQMALNTFKATLVKYSDKGGSITINGATIVNGASDTEEVANTASKETIKDDNKMQFAEQYCTKLVMDDADEDNFGRPATSWTYDKDEVGVYQHTDDAVVIYTEDTKADKVKKDLKSYDYETGLKATVNGDTGAAISTYTDVATLTGDGRTVEVYADNKEITDVIVINTISAKVTSINKSKETFTISFNGKTAVIDEDSDFYGLYGKVEKDDILAVSANKANEVLNLYVPETVEGKITYVKSNNTQATVAGETVKADVNTSNLFQGKLDQDSVVYLSKEGFAIFVDAKTSSDAEYIYVTNMWTESGSKYDDEDKYYAMGVLTDGTIETFQIINGDATEGTVNSGGAVDTTGDKFASDLKYGTADGTAVIPGSLPSKPNKVYEYKESSDEAGLYVLLNEQAAGASQIGITEKAAGNKLDADASKLGSNYFASDVTFVYVSGDGDSLKASTGPKAAISATPAYTGVIEKVDDRYLVTVVFVGSSGASSDDVVYISDDLGTQKYVDGDGKTKTGYKVEYFAKGDTEAQEMIVSQGKPHSVGFYTLTSDGDAYETEAYGREDTDKKTRAEISDMFNGHVTLADSSEFDFNKADIIDTTDNGLSSVEALQSAVETEDQIVKVSFTYDANDKVETVYVQDVLSTDVGIDSVYINGKQADVASSTGTSVAVEVAKDTALKLTVNLSNSDASYVATFDNDNSDGYSYLTFDSNSKSANGDSKTGEFQIVVTAEDGTTSATYYVQFVTPAPAAG